jgi:uncharacterized HAD superfamily protein
MTSQRKKSNALKIGVDIDGVLMDHTRAKIRKARELGYRIVPRQTHGVTLKALLSHPDYKKLQRYIYGKETLRMPAIRSALKGFRHLAKNAEVYVISRRKTQKHPRQWFAKKLKTFPQKHIFFVKKDTDKDAVAARLGVEAFIDDRLSVLKALPSVRRKFLLDEHGTFSRVPKNITVVRTWDDFLKKVKRFL